MGKVVTPTSLESNRTLSDAALFSQLDSILSTLDRIVLGKSEQIRLAVACILANGHLLIEDVPGMGKTTLAQSLARVLGLDFSRLQFTSDMLPADVTGVSIFRKDTNEFSLHKGPIFSQLVLADEVNRATPKTQSALLEAMEERQVSIDGISHALPQPFFVVATQNPTEQVGTYSLPESQLDRFFMRISLGYPDREHERVLLTGGDRRKMLEALDAVISATDLIALQQAARRTHTSEVLLDYIQNIIEFSRHDNRLSTGISPRASLVLLQAARAWAYLHQRDGVTPEDVQKVLPAVVDHRVQFRRASNTDSQEKVSDYLLRLVAIP